MYIVDALMVCIVVMVLFLVLGGDVDEVYVGDLGVREGQVCISDDSLC